MILRSIIRLLQTYSRIITNNGKTKTMTAMAIIPQTLLPAISARGNKVILGATDWDVMTKMATVLLIPQEWVHLQNGM